MKKKLNFKQKSNQINGYAKYSSLAIQMIVILLGGALGGREIDRYFHLETPVFTLILSLFGLFAVLYLTIRSVTRK